MDLHVNSTNEVVDLRPAGAELQSKLSPTKPLTGNKETKARNKPFKSKAGTSDGLRITTVKAAEDRGEGWDDQVDERLGDWLGRSSPPPTSALSSPAASTSRSPSRSEVSEPPSPMFPNTQPLGASTLGPQYAHPDDVRPSSPISLLSSSSDEDGKSPQLAKSRKRGVGDSPSNTAPFRRRRDSRAEGGLSAHNSSAWGWERRYEAASVESR